MANASWGNKGTKAQGNKETAETNIVENFTLKCWEVFQNKEQPNLLRMRCGFGGGKRQDGNGYKKEVYVTVWVNTDECDIKEDDYNNSIIAVYGRMSAREWTNSNTGETSAQLHIDASKVVKREFNNR